MTPKMRFNCNQGETFQIHVKMEWLKDNEVVFLNEKV